MEKVRGYLLRVRSWFLMSWYMRFYKRPGLKDTWILIDPRNGKDLAGNMLRIAEELSHDPAYRRYKIFISYVAGRRSPIRKTALQYGLGKSVMVLEGGFRYAKVAAQARYIFMDTSIPHWYIKKKGQIITNTWHGTPLKKMGKDVADQAYDMGNVQKCQLIADYLIYPSDYMKGIMASAYCLEDLYQGKILYSGYPRNSIFFRPAEGRRLAERLGLEGKRLYGYMPTWRGTLQHIDQKENVSRIEGFLDILDRELKEDEIFFVRLHPFVRRGMDHLRYEHIRLFPEGYDPYDILNMCSCLVTDYSSVMFDHADSRKKVILFVYDKASYMDVRGVYMPMDTFPFPQVDTVEGLLRELRTPKGYDDSAFVETFCQYDCVDAAQKLCRHIVGGEKVFEEHRMDGDGKEKVLVYAGDLSKNGLTTALLNLFSNIDKSKRDYYITFRGALLREDPKRVTLLPQGVGLRPIAFTGGETLGEIGAVFLYFYLGVENPFVTKKLERYFRRLYQINFEGCSFSSVIQYSGYERLMIHMFLQAPVKKMIFVHNDMVKETASKYKGYTSTFKKAYHDYDRVVPVTQDIYAPTLQLGGRKENIQVVNNCHDHKAVLERSKRALAFEEDTQCTLSLQGLEGILEGDHRKIITIGRFSPEKGHEMLLKAFDRYHRDRPDSYLIIIGGYGPLYEQTLSLAGSLPCGSHVVIIRSIANPMPILKRCDLFVLSSLYEGLGLTLLEADTLGIPVISTDIPGPHGFLERHGGYLVPPDEEGIYRGFQAFDEGKVKVMGVDYEQYDRKCVQEFEDLFSER